MDPSLTIGNGVTSLRPMVLPILGWMPHGLFVNYREWSYKLTPYGLACFGIDAS